MNYGYIKDMRMSKIIIGTDYYNDKYSPDVCDDILDLYIENGGNVIDTARMYCGGKSEEYIGQYIKKRDLKNKVIISTKAAHPPIECMSKSRLSKNEIYNDVESSLIALKTDCIDLLWLHRDDESLPVEPIIDTLESLVKSGKIRHYGASNWNYKRIEAANNYAISVSAEGFIASQIQWSLAKHNGSNDPTLVIMNDNEYEYYKKTKIPVFAFCSQAKGFFEKFHTGTLSQKAKERFYNDENIQMYNNLKTTSEQTGKTISSLSLEYLMDNVNFDTFPIIGPSNVTQLKNSLNIY